LDREIKLMQAIGTIPVLIRFCYHESDERHRFLADVVKDLHTQRHAVSIALVQNREAVLEPSRWESFMEKVLYQTAGHTEYVEVGHAINRVKWGIWNLDEHRRLMEAVLRAKEKYPAVSFTGPAVIDFEYPFLMAALKNVPGSLRFAALSHHLYVDRRGAPENRQGGFSALEKFALAHAIARWSGVCDDKLIISEVNWPLKGTGVYSPVTSPYESPGPRHGDPSVSEAEYGDYMLRYLAIAICSGMVDRVYWWRLVARGFGLVDDTDPVQWRERPAYRMLKHFVALLSSATFVEKSAMAQGQHLFMFSLPDGDKIYLAYSEHGEQQVELPFECTHIVDAEGHDIACTGRSIRISDHPIYVFAE